MKVLLCAILFVSVLIQSFVHSSVPQAERRQRKESAFGIKRFVPQAEHPRKRNLWDNLFDENARVQDVCMWRCQDWCRDRCRNSDNEECLDACLNIYGHRWGRCIRKCQRGDLDRPGAGGEESEEEKEEDYEE